MNLGNTVVTFVTRYNYVVGAWMIDVLDAQENTLVAGVMLYPGFDLLARYPELQDLGVLTVFEVLPGDYQGDDTLGVNVQLLWFAPGVTPVFQYA